MLRSRYFTSFVRSSENHDIAFIFFKRPVTRLQHVGYKKVIGVQNGETGLLRMLKPCIAGRTGALIFPVNGPDPAVFLFIFMQNFRGMIRGAVIDADDLNIR